ncbi:carbohydrate ABC transporter permease [Treponema parvum]|uniref:Maltose/maltodextrin transport system permease protein MalG n=1 Tax=Treponema parvum TaxID=138851 RepID=A0A975EYD1_9SPIR|nr:carbohydrate ABC transporter permease [Treponema parvum]QTQ11078.1 carbohydrate ABC transporter permease [Treponema parvum]
MKSNKPVLTRKEKKRQNLAIVVMFLFILPVAVMFASFFVMAFFKDGELTLQNFEFVVRAMKLRDQTTIQPIGKALGNSVIFTLCVTFAEVVISLLAGYALSRLSFKGRRTIQTGLLILRMFPTLLLLIAVLYVLMAFGIANTLLGVVLVAIAFRLPGSTYIIKNFFDSIPRDIENSTLVDGCTRFSGFRQVIIYLVKPGIVSITVFSFLSAWSNFILFNTLLFGNKTPVIATYIRAITRNEQMIASFNIVAAMGIIYMLPVLVFFIMTQRQLMEGNINSSKGF